MPQFTTRAEAIQWLRQFSPAQVERLIVLMESALSAQESEVRKP